MMSIRVSNQAMREVLPANLLSQKSHLRKCFPPQEIVALTSCDFPRNLFAPAILNRSSLWSYSLFKSHRVMLTLFSSSIPHMSTLPVFSSWMQ